MKRARNRAFQKWWREYKGYLWWNKTESFEIDHYDCMPDSRLIEFLNMRSNEVSEVMSRRTCSARNAFESYRNAVYLARIARVLRDRHPDIPAEDLLVWLNLTA